MIKKISTFVLATVLATNANANTSANANATPNNPFAPDAYKARESHSGVTAYALGEGEHRVYVFVPHNAPKPLPLVFLHHGWQGMNPMNFGALIDHLALTGNAVIYPVYQQSDKTHPAVITQNAVNANRQALAFLKKHHTIDDKKAMYIGFSMGAAITLNIAAKPDHFGLPKPLGVVLLNAGDAHHVKKGEAGNSIISNLATIPKDTYLAVMTGQADTSIGVPTAKKIAQAVCHLPANQRVFLNLPSDSHAGITVKSGHGSAGALDERYDFALTDNNFPKYLPRRTNYYDTVSLNPLDFYGYWRVITTLNDSLKAGTPTLVGVGKNSLPLGVWADGTAFAPMTVTPVCGTTNKGVV